MKWEGSSNLVSQLLVQKCFFVAILICGTVLNTECLSDDFTSTDLRTYPFADTEESPVVGYSCQDCSSSKVPSRSHLHPQQTYAEEGNQNDQGG